MADTPVIESDSPTGADNDPPSGRRPNWVAITALATVAR